MSSGLFILLKIALEWSINSQTIWRRVVDKVLMNNSPLHMFSILLLLERYHQNSKVVWLLQAWMEWTLFSVVLPLSLSARNLLETVISSHRACLKMQELISACVGFMALVVFMYSDLGLKTPAHHAQYYLPVFLTIHSFLKRRSPQILQFNGHTWTA